MLNKIEFTAIILCCTFIAANAIDNKTNSKSKLFTTCNYTIDTDTTVTNAPGKESVTIFNDSLREVTLIENFIIYHNMIKENRPKSFFETEVNRALLTWITNMYLFHKSPYDTCMSLGYGDSKLCNSFKKGFEEVDFEEYDKQFHDQMKQNSQIIQVKHGDFWNEIYKINKEYANPNGWTLIEKSIKEAQEAFGFENDDTIFIRKETLKEHREVLEDIFTNMKNHVNPIYLK